VKRHSAVGAVAVAAVCAAVSVRAQGARHFKSGPIQVTADGRWVWVANDTSGSVTRLDTRTEGVRELVVSGCWPGGVSIREDGRVLWITCPEQDAVVVMDAFAETTLARLEMPYGSYPAFVALSPDQAHAVVTLNRGDAVALIDAALRRVTEILPTHRSPLGAAWTADGASAWLTHAGSDGRDTFLTEPDVDSAGPRVAARVRIPMQEPQATRLFAVFLAEGGAVTMRGHLAQRPGVTPGEVWVPVQHTRSRTPRLARTRRSSRRFSASTCRPARSRRRTGSW
jgi:hypothetical protein